jgi:predicted acyltransferase
MLRGITIAFMIFVNSNMDGDHSFWAFNHADWNGFTPTDLVFPTFLFLVGISLVFSTQSRLARSESRSALLGHAVRRSVILFALGVVVNGFPFFHLGTLRIYGVLQRIAICYLIGSLLYIYRQSVKYQVALLVFALAAYWVIMRWIPVPGYGLPVRDIPLLDKNANWVAVVDRHLFPGRLYEGTRDPEGLISNLPALGTLLLGMLTAAWLRTSRTLKNKLYGQLVAGAACILLGGTWNHWFPINKKLWTSSYVLYAGGWSLLLLAFCFWLVEIRKVRRGLMPWLAFGSNAIAVYMIAELMEAGLGSIPLHKHMSVFGFFYLRILAIMPRPEWATIVFSAAYVTLCWIPIYILYRRKIFLKI